MSRSSTATVRETPISEVSNVTAGGFTVRGETLTVDTSERVQIVDLTEQVMAAVRSLGVREGLVSLCSLHTTCCVFVNEYQAALVADIRRFLEQFADRDADWRHNDPGHSDCDRQNADSHLRALLLGHSLTLQLHNGEVVLGQWQRVLMGELDGPRPRTLRLQVLGV